MSMIYDGVKRGDEHFDTAQIRDVLRTLTGDGADAFILGCTELPIAFRLYGLPGRTIDPTLVLARAAVEACGAPLKVIVKRCCDQTIWPQHLFTLTQQTRSVQCRGFVSARHG